MSEIDPTRLLVGLQDGKLFSISAQFRLTEVLSAGSAIVSVVPVGSALYGVNVRGEVFEGARRSAPLGAEPVGVVPYRYTQEGTARDVLAVALARSVVSFVDPATLSVIDAVTREPLTPMGIANAGGTLLVSTWEAVLLRLDEDKLWSYIVPESPRRTAPLHFRGVSVCGAYALCPADLPIVFVYEVADLYKAPRSIQLDDSPAAALVPWNNEVLALTKSGAVFSLDPASGTRSGVDGAVVPNAIAAVLAAKDVLAVLAEGSLGFYRLPAAPGDRLVEERKIRFSTVPAVSLALR